MLLQENTMFANRYQLERLLGRGGFSEVWLAKDSYTKLDIAIKVYAPGQGMDSDGLADFSQELAGVFNLNHTNLLKPTHVDAWEGMPYLIMPFCSCGSITKRVGKMQEDEIWKLIHDVASGLAYLHKKDIIHQDIKPDNILLDDNGNYVITDFGISTKARSTLRKSAIGGAVSGGTMAYMGPERFSKQPAPTKASDIWSFGAMLYELITGNVPFGEMGGGMQKGGAEIPEINEPISDKLRRTIESMLALETWDRPTAEQLVQTTADYADNLPTSRTTQRMVPPAQTEPAAGESSTGGKKIGLVKIFAWVIVSILCILVPIAAYYLHNNTSTSYNNTPASYNNTPTSYHEPSVNTLDTAQAKPIEDDAVLEVGERLVEETPIVKESTITPSPSIKSGTCGDNLKWSFDSANGELKITGAGKMTDWVRDPNGYPQWHNVRKSIKIITLPEGLASVGANAFFQCSNLKYISIPSSVTYIEGGSFYGCSSLKTIIISNSETWLGSGAFEGCSSLNAITLPSSLTWMPGRTFKGCKALKSITLPEKITSIEYEAFLGCTSLTSITIPNSVKYVGNDAFKGCSSLREIRYPADLNISNAGIPSSTKLIPYER